jgi:polysaccharide deacetylase family protein (PEP-CTERM system associated)
MPGTQLTPAGFREDLDTSREIIQQASGTLIKGFRAPQFSIDRRCLWAFQVLTDAGYQFDSSVFPARSWLYGYADAPREPYRPLKNGDLVEYPLATVRLGTLTLPAVGGVYTRLLPYRLIRWAILRLNKEGIAAILYLHPWELDLAQPRIPVNPRERLTHYGLRSSLAPKLQRLWRDFHFAPLGEVHQAWLQAN